MKKIVTTAFIAMFISLPTWANGSDIEQTLERAAQKAGYCVDGVSSVKPIGSRYFAAYTAFGSYDSDSGCSGNASWSQLAELSYRNGRYVVNNLNILENHNFTYIDDIRISDDGIATLTTRAYSHSDTQHNPRDKRTVRIRLIDGTILNDRFNGRVEEPEYFDEY